MCRQWIGLVLCCATAVQAANDAGPQRDLSWGVHPADNGLSYIAFDIAGSGTDIAGAATVQADGRYVIGGIVATSSALPASWDAALARLQPSHGVLDAGFGTGGRARLGPGFDLGVTDLVAMADGRLVYATRTAPNVISIGRLLADGTPDPGFDGDGRRSFTASTFLPAGDGLAAPKIAVQADGRIVVASSITRFVHDYESHALVLRLHADGSTDTTFGDGSGFALYAPAGDASPAATATAIARLADGRWLVGGSVRPAAAGVTKMATFRLSADGVLDTSYGTQGFAFLAVGQSGLVGDDLTALAIDTQGRAVVTGNIYLTLHERWRIAVARYTAQGTVDPGFGDDGTTVLDIDAGSESETSHSIAVLPGGRLLVGGRSMLCGACSLPDAATLTQLERDGSVNRFFGIDGSERFGSEAGPPSQVLSALHMQVAGDHVYLAGMATSPTGSSLDFATARLIVPLFKGGFDVADPALRHAETGPRNPADPVPSAPLGGSMR